MISIAFYDLKLKKKRRAVLKAKQLGAKVVTISGPDGYIYDEEGINTDEKINFMHVGPGNGFGVCSMQQEWNRAEGGNYTDLIDE